MNTDLIFFVLLLLLFSTLHQNPTLFYDFLQERSKIQDSKDSSGLYFVKVRYYFLLLLLYPLTQTFFFYFCVFYEFMKTFY